MSTPDNETRRFAAVDLGSNGFRLHVGQHDGAGMRVLKTVREPIRLAAGLDANGCLSEAAIGSALACLADFRRALSAWRPDAVRVVATSTLRVARNGAALLPAAGHALGHPVEIISAQEEGRLIYLGVAHTLATPEARLVIDIGGGSTELIQGRGAAVERIETFNVGSVRQSLAFFADGRIDAVSFEAAVLSARSHFADAAPSCPPRYWKHAYGSSGTIRALGALIARNGLGDGKISGASLDALKRRFIEAGQVAGLDLPGLRPQRAATLVGGLAILIALVAELGIEMLTPVKAGLPMGVMWDLFLSKSDSRPG
ncbi:MAG: Ppx/GppA family phosphatase [Telluria sp.]|nr:Ppx/GppA family phosphatase [Telluria sp.]